MSSHIQVPKGLQTKIIRIYFSYAQKNMYGFQRPVGEFSPIQLRQYIESKSAIAFPPNLQDLLTILYRQQPLILFEKTPENHWGHCLRHKGAVGGFREIVTSRN